MGVPFEEFTEAVAAQTPLRRVGQPEDVAGTIAYLCSEDASYVSGQVIYVAAALRTAQPARTAAPPRLELTAERVEGDVLERHTRGRCELLGQQREHQLVAARAAVGLRRQPPP